jgi:hypothetical protein
MDEFSKATDGANVHCHDRYGLPPCDDTDDADSEIEVDCLPLQWIFDDQDVEIISQCVLRRRQTNRCWRRQQNLD